MKKIAGILTSVLMLCLLCVNVFATETQITPSPSKNTQIAGAEGTINGKPITPDNLGEAVQIVESNKKPDSVPGMQTIDMVDILVSDKADINYVLLYNPAFKPGDRVVIRLFKEDGSYTDVEAIVSENKTVRVPVSGSTTAQIMVNQSSSSVVTPTGSPTVTPTGGVIYGGGGYSGGSGSIGNTSTVSPQTGQSSLLYVAGAFALVCLVAAAVAGRKAAHK